MLSLTIVIPVYNEEHHIKDCLESIAAQTVLPDEVLVIDNNCTDRTIEIAKTYSFVRVITEKNQGRGYARTAGFNAASSGIIGRIDADSRLADSWVERVKNHFTSDESLQGLTGLGKTSFFPGVNSWRTTLFARAYYWYVHAGFRTITMWGATCALRKSAWESVKDDVCLDDSLVHEDQDVSLWMAAKDLRIDQKNDVRIETGGQTYRYLPKLLHYSKLYRSTKRFHKKNGNLQKVKKLSYPSLLPGIFGAAALSLLLAFGSTVFFPIDYLMIHSRHRRTWLD